MIDRLEMTPFSLLHCGQGLQIIDIIDYGR
jgi:hypothetical protein